MSGVKRVFVGLLLVVYLMTMFPTGVVFAQEDALPTEETLEESIEITGEEQTVVEVDDTLELDPSMYADEEFCEEELPEEEPVEEEFLEEDLTEEDPVVEEFVEELPEVTDEIPEVTEELEVLEEESDESLTESESSWEPIPEDAGAEALEALFMETEETEEDVELQGLFNCDGNHYETKANNVTYFNKAEKGRVKKGTIAKKGTVVAVVGSKYVGIWPFGENYQRLNTGYWVLSGNLKHHDCTGGNRTTTYRWIPRSGDNKNHDVQRTISAQYCTKSPCKCIVKNADVDKAKQKHSGWYSTGYCGDCGYKFVIKEKNITDATYMVTENLYLRKEPYSNAGTASSLLKTGSVITLVKKAENCHGNLWYKTDSGSWVYSGNVVKHSHSYSSQTGKCVCGRMYDYEIKSQSNKPFQTKGSYCNARQHPFSTSPVKKKYYSDSVFYVNAYSFSDPNGNWFNKGTKWFRTTDGYWVDTDSVKEHTKHSYTAASQGKCSYDGCTNEYELKVKWFNWSHSAVTYETTGANKVARVKPYSKATKKQTYAYKYQIVNVDRYVDKNANGEGWLQTTKGYWIKASDVQPHAHHLVAGSCTSVDCGFVTNMGLKSMSSTLYETTQNNVLVKDKPFGDATTNRTLGKAKSIRVNGYTTKLDEKWFRTTDDKYIKASQLKTHKHSYTDGYCAVCGQYAEYTTQTINPKIVETAKANVTVWDKPYNKSKVKKTYGAKGQQLVIAEQATNYYKNIWYKVSTGGWVYSGDIKVPSGGSIKTSNKATLQTYIITVTDNRNQPIKNATIQWLGETYKANENGNVELMYVTEKTTFTVSAPQYDSVTKKDYQMNKNRKETIVLPVAGSFEAASVNMTYVGKTTDLLKSERTINHYHTQGIFNEELIKIKCVMGSTTGIGSYKLMQGNKVIATSKNGVFEGLKVKDFTPKKTVELRVYDTGGTQRAKQKLLLNVFNEGQENAGGGSLELGGTSVSVSLSENVPLVGGMKFNFDLPKGIPFGVDIGDESTKYALNFQIPTKKDGQDKETFKSEYSKFWKDAKELTTGNWKKMYNRKAIENVADKAAWKGKLRVGGYAEKMHGESVIKGKIFVEGSIKMENYHQMMAGPVPVVLEIEVEGKITPYGEFVVTNFKKISGFKLGLDLQASVEAAAGVGLKYVATLSVYGKATLKIEGELIPDPGINNVYLYGNLGLKAKVLDMEIVNWKFFETPTLYIVQDGKFVLWETAELAEFITDENNYTPITRQYLNNRTTWYTDPSLSLMEEGSDEEVSIVVSDFDFDVLQSSTYTDIRPQVVTADGTIMMVYNDDNAARGDLDKTMLVYSLYNTGSKEWSVPVPVQDDGTADYGFSVCNSNDEIYIVWQNAKTQHEVGASLTDISRNTELTVAKYDAVLGSFQHIEQVTDNDSYEHMPRIASVNGKTVVSWFTNSDDDVFMTTGTNRVEYAYKLDEDYAPKQDYVIDDSDMTDEELEEELRPSDEEPTEGGEELPPADGVLEPDVEPDEIVLTEEPAEDAEADVPVEEESDEEEETETPTSWNFGSLDAIDDAITSLAVGYMLDESYIAYTTDADGNTATIDDQMIWLFDTQTEELMEYTDQASNVEFTEVHGDRAMTWYNQGMIYYALDGYSAPQQLYTEPTNLGDEYHIISDASGNMAILFTVMQDEASNASLMLYDNETFEWGLPIAVTNQDKYIRNFNGAYADGMIVSIFNQTQVTEDEMNETNNLCSAIIGERHDMAIANAVFTDFELVAGEKKPLSVDVRNNGTVRISNFMITVYNAEEDVVAQQTVEKVLKSGETTNVELEITMPQVLEKTTYTVEIEEIDQSDAYPADNTLDVTVGRAALMVSAESSPTDTENIVVLTIENAGYEPSSGMIALFDENNQVIEVLAENFRPVGHGEVFTCAIALNNEYFSGAASKVFNIGVVPTEEQDVNAYNIASVYVDNIHHDNQPDIDIGNVDLTDTVDDETPALMEETARTISGKVRNETDDDIENAKICVLAYDDRGIFQNMTYLETVSLVSGEEFEFTAAFEDMENISIIKIALINGDNLEPLSPAVEIRILDDLTDENEGVDESEDYEAIMEEEG